MLTEDEAKTKWCPLAVASHTDPRRGFREGQEPSYGIEFPCISSACMAWRAETTLVRADGSFNREPEPTGRGYCGAFGR